MQDATGKWQRTEYSPLGMALRVCEGNGSGAATCTADIYFEPLSVDARGNLLMEKRGAVYVKRTFDIFNGRLMRICSGRTTGSEDCSLQDENYTWDNRGNLLSRARGALYTEHFRYDAADRLTKGWFSNIGGLNYGIAEPALKTDAKVSEWFVYDKLGNICERNYTGLIAAYAYAGRAGCGANGLPGSSTTATTGAHELVGWWNYGITRDANGNQAGATENGATVKGYVYTAQNQAWSVWNGASQAAATQRTRWFYASDGSRYKRIDDGSANIARTVLTLGNVERVTTGAVVTWRRSVAGGSVVNYTGATPTWQNIRTQLHDHIGSIVVIADTLGYFVENADHGAFGNRRGWVGSTQLGQLGLTWTDRGFTGHEHAQNLDTIHMNGRIYDPVQARFLQADPLVQDPYNPQNWNPFAYVYNNPLANTDPTGMMSVGQMLRTVVAIVVAIYAPYLLAPYMSAFAATVTAGFISGAISSGTLKGGLIGAFSAGMFYGIGSTFAGVEAAGALTAGQAGAKMLMHGLAGGVMSQLQGGKFGHGFASAAVTQAFSSKIDGIDRGAAHSAKRVIAAAALGGTVSVATGEKFANGAITGAFSRAFNDEAHLGANDSEDAQWGASLPSAPQGLVDSVAGFGDTLSFGLSKYVRDANSIGSVEYDSGAYAAGEVGGVAYSTVFGGAVGWRLAGRAGRGLEFSHWVPNRWGGVRSLWNGNYVTTMKHALSDPFRYRFMPRTWKFTHPLPSVIFQQWTRIPYVWKGSVGGFGYGAAAVEVNDD